MRWFSTHQFIGVLEFELGEFNRLQRADGGSGELGQFIGTNQRLRLQHTLRLLQNLRLFSVFQDYFRLELTELRMN